MRNIVFKLFKHLFNFVYASLLVQFGVNLANAVEVTGRFSVGGYAAKEMFSDTSKGANSNDFETLSARAYLKLQKLGDFEAAFDLRDKNDFFDKLDAEKLALSRSNEFQIREANFKYPNPDGTLYATLGRFSIIEAGSAFNDGLELGARLSPEFRLSSFAGHNPKRPDTAYLQNDTPDMTFGGYLYFQKKGSSWEKIFNTSLAFVTNTVYQVVDRKYLFLNLLFQWNLNSRLIGNAYLDFVPRTYVQNSSLTYQQGIGENFDASLQFTTVDSIEYTRRRNILEMLPSSPYKEVSANTRYKLLPQWHWLLQNRIGERETDRQRREETSTGFYFPQVYSEKVDLSIHGGYQKEFTTQGPIFRFEINYFSRTWEFGYNLETAVQNRIVNDPDQPATLHPLTTELSIANVFSKSLFSTLSLQYAKNELVTIYSAFLKLTYRFGTADLPPLRDGASPRRSL